MTIEQTVEVPPNRRLTIDVPRDIPAGPVILTFTPKPAAYLKTRDDDEAWKAMAADTEREKEAHEWCSAYFGPRRLRRTPNSRESAFLRPRCLHTR